MISFSVFASILLGGMFLSIVYGVVVDSIKYKKFKKQLQVGTRLKLCYLNEEPEFFNKNCFEIKLTKIGKELVEVQYEDGSKRVFSKFLLYNEQWKIIS